MIAIISLALFLTMPIALYGESDHETAIRSMLLLRAEQGGLTFSQHIEEYRERHNLTRQDVAGILTLYLKKKDDMSKVELILVSRSLYTISANGYGDHVNPELVERWLNCDDQVISTAATKAFVSTFHIDNIDEIDDYCKKATPTGLSMLCSKVADSISELDPRKEPDKSKMLFSTAKHILANAKHYECMDLLHEALKGKDQNYPPTNLCKLFSDLMKRMREPKSVAGQIQHHMLLEIAEPAIIKIILTNTTSDKLTIPPFGSEQNHLVISLPKNSTSTTNIAITPPDDPPTVVDPGAKYTVSIAYKELLKKTTLGTGEFTIKWLINTQGGLSFQSNPIHVIYEKSNQ